MAIDSWLEGNKQAREQLNLTIDQGLAKLERQLTVRSEEAAMVPVPFN